MNECNSRLGFGNGKCLRKAPGGSGWVMTSSRDLGETSQMKRMSFNQASKGEWELGGQEEQRGSEAREITWQRHRRGEKVHRALEKWRHWGWTA